MKIKKIILKNIGPYVNTNEFDLTTNNKKNIILIGGKNGSGKTTFLKAIKYGLFGSFSLGYKTDTKKYYDEILNLVNTENGRKSFYIQINLLILEERIEKEYIIKREWKLVSNSFEEKVTVIDDELMLDEYKSFEFIERLKSLTSPQLINSTIFDGEKIGNIIQNDRIDTFLEETFNALFNVNMLNQLKLDLNAYLEKKTNENISSKEVYSYSLLTEVTSIKNNMKAIDLEMSNLKGKINDLNLRKKDLNKNFLNLGGINKNQLKIIIDELSSITKNVEQKNKLFKYRIENDACFILNLKLLKQAFNQIKKELPLYYLEQLNSIKDYLNVNDSSLDDVMNSRVDQNVKMIHDVGETDFEKLKAIYDTYNSKFLFMKNYILNKDNEMAKINKFKNQIDSQEQIEKFDEIINELNDIDQMIDVLNVELNNKTKKFNDLNAKFSKTYDTLNHINNEIRKSSTYDKSFMVANNAIDINDKFIEYIKETKLSEISHVCTDIFNETIRKEGYVSKIVINSDYSIELYDIFNKEMKLKTLSAGEIQLLISSIIWSMFKVSGRKELFVFDTPLARLDVDNRLSFINNIVKTISDQVIILSTDSEIVDLYYETVEKNSSKIYRLDYINSKKITKIVKGYFG